MIVIAHCKKCKYTVMALAGDERFCPRDGQPLAEKEAPQCTCGRAFWPGRSFDYCAGCGAKIPTSFKEISDGNSSANVNPGDRSKEL